MTYAALTIPINFDARFRNAWSSKSSRQPHRVAKQNCGRLQCCLAWPVTFGGAHLLFWMSSSQRVMKRNTKDQDTLRRGELASPDAECPSCVLWLAEVPLS